MRFAHLGRFVIRARWWILGAALVFFVAAGGYGARRGVPPQLRRLLRPRLRERQGVGVPHRHPRHRHPERHRPRHAEGRHHRRRPVGRGRRRGADRGARRPARRRPGRLLLDARQRAPAALGHRLVGPRAGPDQRRRRRGARGGGRCSSEEFSRDGDLVVTRVGGVSEAFREVSETIEHDLRTAELHRPAVHPAPPAASCSAAWSRRCSRCSSAALVDRRHLPRAQAARRLTEVSIFALNLTTALGLGLAIDYSLLVVSRLPGGARARATPPRTPSCAPSSPPGGPWCSAASPSPCRSARCSCSRVAVPALVRLRRHPRGGAGGDRRRRRAAGDARRPRRPRRQPGRPRPAPAGAGRPAAGADLLVPHRPARDAPARPDRRRASSRCCSSLGAPFLRIATGTARRPGAARPAPGPARSATRSAPTTASKDIGALAVVFPDGSPDDAARSRPTPPRSRPLDGRGPGRRRHRHLRRTAPEARPTPPSITDRFRTRRPGRGCRWCPSVEPMSPTARSSSRRRAGRGRRRCDVLVGGTVGRSSSTSRRPSSSGCRWALGDHRRRHLRAAVPDRSAACSCRSRRWCSTPCSLTATFGAMVWIFQDGNLADAPRLHRHRRCSTPPRRS